MKLLWLLPFIFFVQQPHAAASPQKFYFTGSFKRSKKIWGTYGQYRESVMKVNEKGRRIYRKFYKSPLANLVIKDGQVHFIRPLVTEEKIKYQIKSFPYARDREKKIFKIHPEGRNEELILFFKDNLVDLVKNDKELRKLDFSKDHVDIVFDDFTCWQKKGKLHCQFPVEIIPSTEDDPEKKGLAENDIIEDVFKQKLSAPLR